MAFPHSEISGSVLASSSPKHIAGSHVLLRFDCLGILYKLLFTWITQKLEISGFEPLTFALQKQRSTNWAISPWAILDLNQGPHPYQGCALTNWANSPQNIQNRFKENPLEEVIQPHLPVRLPCYDFTPVTSPTLGVFLHVVGITT